MAFLSFIPKTVPGYPWTFDGPKMDLINCTPCLARDVMINALNKSDAQYSYNESKFKAKCYIYTRTGYCFFIARIYAYDAIITKETKYVIELQRRDGSSQIFQEKSVQIFNQIKMHSPLIVHTVEDHMTNPLFTYAELSQMPGLPGVPAELLLSGAATPSYRYLISNQPLIEHTIYLALCELSQIYDDIATRGAMSLVSMLCSSKESSVILERFSQSPQIHHIVDILVRRINDKRTSIYCKTLCAFCLEDLCKDPQIIKLIGQHVPQIIGIVSELSFEPRIAVLHNTLCNITQQISKSMTGTKTMVVSATASVPAIPC
jgi:hypothetical protein